jgi:hypothetical protein
VESRQDISHEAHELHTSTTRAVLAGSKPLLAHSPDQAFVSTNLPKVLPPLREELALWKVFISDEIESILKDE